MSKVSLEKVTKVYSNGFEAVHGIDLEIQDSEFMIMFGPSGCAKSTTLRMLAGLEPISGGQIKIGEELLTACAKISWHCNGIPKLCTLSAHECS